MWISQHAQPDFTQLMDDMSMAWYPAFLDETMKLFFNKDDRMPQAQDLVLDHVPLALVRIVVEPFREIILHLGVGLLDRAERHQRLQRRAKSISGSDGDHGSAAGRIDVLYPEKSHCLDKYL